MLENFKDLYEVRKTVRFELKPSKVLPKIKIKNIDENFINEFFSNYNKLLEIYEKVFFNNREINGKIKFSFSFLKTNLKKEYYELWIDKIKKSASVNKIKLEKIDNYEKLNSSFLSTLKKQNEYVNSFKEKIESPYENRSRKSELVLLIYNLKKRNNFPFIENAFNNVTAENIMVDDEIKKWNMLAKTISNQLVTIEEELLPQNSMWLVIERATFNYFTINKTPIDYDIAIKNKKNKYNEIIWKQNKLKNTYKKQSINEFIKYIIEDGFSKFENQIYEQNGKYIDTGRKWSSFNELTIENAYTLMKKYKSDQKTAFYEIIKKEKYNFLKSQNNKITITYNKDSFNDKKEEITVKLFDDISKWNFDKIAMLTKKIETLAELKNYLEKKEFNKFQEKINTLQEIININFNNDNEEEVENLVKRLNADRVLLKKERWTYFDKESNNFAFTKYKEFCEVYQEVAMTLWKAKADIKSLEKEKIQSLFLKSWALIVENKEKNQFHLLTIPKKNISKARNIILALKNWENNNNILYLFESLTLRALKKLCFWKEFSENRGDYTEKSSPFRKSIEENITNSDFDNINFYIEKQKKDGNNYRVLKQYYDFYINKEENKELDEELLIKFYKSVLQLPSTLEQIIIKNFPDYESFISKEFNNLEEFEEGIKRTFYIKQPLKIEEHKLNKLIKEYNWNLYKITNYNLIKNDLDEIKELKEKERFNRNHIKNHSKLWWNFWEKENIDNKYPIRINPEIAISFVKKDDNFYEENHNKLFKNRRFQDRFLLTTSMTEFATNKSIYLSYKELSELKNFYNSYNYNFSENFKWEYIYWIDRWDNELASLWLFRNINKNIEAVKIETYKLKNENLLFKEWTSNTPAYKNISNYIEKDELFEIKEVSCIDLTLAKLIKWKIVLNWDISTYINLKITAAKRSLYNIFSKWNYKEWDIIEKWKFKDKNTGEEWYDWTLKFNQKEIYKNNSEIEKIISIDKVKNILEEYIEEIKQNIYNEDISIEKINHLRDSICSNMIGIINFLQEKYSWYMFLENKKIIDLNKNFLKDWYQLGTRFEQKLLQKFSNLNLVPSNYKLFLSIRDEDKEIKQLWIIRYIDENSTSSACPVCNPKLYNVNSDDINKLYWHWKWEEKEKSMHHINDKNDENHQEWKWESWKLESWDLCDFHIWYNEKYPDFSFIKSWDDLATYNIAKKALEYLEYLKSLNNDETK